MDPELAHTLTLKVLSRFNGVRPATRDDPRLRVKALGLEFHNPVGLAAGFDKNAEVTEAMLGLGFGFVESGTVTPRPQAGNEKPRIFRLVEDGAVINRLGFNNRGLDAARARLERLAKAPGIRGVNIGANKNSSDRIADYVTGLRVLGPYASYMTINVSSPNTPGLRGLQNKAELHDLLSAIVAERAAMARKIPLLVKIAPDLETPALGDVVDLAFAHGIDGLVASNTTIARPSSLKSRHAREAGGLSGRPLFAPSTEVLRTVRKLSQGRLLLVGVGGISSGAEAYAKIRAGASLVQLYTAMTYQGPFLIERIKKELVALLERDNIAGIAHAVGVDA